MLNPLQVPERSNNYTPRRLTSESSLYILMVERCAVPVIPDAHPMVRA